MKKIETGYILSWHANLPYISSAVGRQLNVALYMNENDITRRKTNMATKTAKHDSDQ